MGNETQEIEAHKEFDQMNFIFWPFFRLTEEGRIVKEWHEELPCIDKNKITRLLCQ